MAAKKTDKASRLKVEESLNKVVATNRRARRDYDILDTFEVGIVLRGSEVKARREANVQLADSYGRVSGGEVWLHGLHIVAQPEPELRRENRQAVGGIHCEVDGLHGQASTCGRRPRGDDDEDGEEEYPGTGARQAHNRSPTAARAACCQVSQGFIGSVRPSLSNSAVLESAEFHHDPHTTVARPGGGRDPHCGRHGRLQWRWKLACLVIVAIFSHVTDAVTRESHRIVVGHGHRFVGIRADDMVAQSVGHIVLRRVDVDRQRDRDEGHRHGVWQRVWQQHHVFAVRAARRR